MRRREFLIGGISPCAARQAARAADGQTLRIHDPALIREPDTFYLFGTGRGIAMHSSHDLKSWTKEPPVFDTSPAWCASVVANFQGRFWAQGRREDVGDAAGALVLGHSTRSMRT